MEKIEKHLYRRQYQTAGGDWSTKFYAIFTCWDRKRRTFPARDTLSDARDELGRLRTLDKGRYDFDAEKREQERAKVKAMTLSEWLDRYLALMKETPSYETKMAQCGPLKRLLGHHPLSDVTKVRIMEYKQRRLSEPIVRHKKPIEGTTIQGATANREVSCLIAALNLAADEGLIDDVPKVKKERETPRERTLTSSEYQSLLNVSPRWLQRVLIAANEAALDQGVLLSLTWESVKDGLISVKGGRSKTGVKQRVGVSPDLADVLDELRAEQRKVPNLAKLVFTKGGKAIPKATLRHAFDNAVKDAKVDDFQFRDFRHCARTRWAAMGLPYEIAEGALGHKLPGMAGRYTNLTDEHIRQAFKNCLQDVNTEKLAATT